MDKVVARIGGLIQEKEGRVGERRKCGEGEQTPRHLEKSGKLLQ